MSRVSRILSAAGAALAISIAPLAPAIAAPDPTGLTLAGPTQAPMHSVAHLTAALTDSASGSAAPVAGEPVALEMLTGGGWHLVSTATTSADGTASYAVTIRQTHNSFRAVYAGSDAHGAATSSSLSVGGIRLSTRLQLTSRSWRFKDGDSRTLRLLWRAGDGEPVPGVVTVYRKPRGTSTFHRYRSFELGSDGRTSFSVSPHEDTVWRATGGAGQWWLGDVTASHLLDNLPPGRPVSYPAAAPRPQPLPAQPRATGHGAHVVIGHLDNPTWRSMVGRSWHSGCPVGRAQLRIIHVNYWDFAGYRRRGQVVLRSDVAQRAGRALAEMYAGHFPIRAMYRVDRFGYSRRTHGGNDYAAMRHDNTDGFNCRWVDGAPGVMSPHAYGTAIDLNTFENPYHSAIGIVPDRWWAAHSRPRYAWRSRSNPVVRIWLRHGFHWTYGDTDSQHMDARGGTPIAGSFVAD